MRERIDQPERGEEERALLARQAVLAFVHPVAVDEHALTEMLGDGADRRADPRVAVAEETHLTDAEDRSVERVAVELLVERTAVRRVAPRGDRAVDGHARAPPRRPVVRQVVALRYTDAPVDGDPAHQLAVRVL